MPQLPKDIVEQILVGEAAGEGEEGLRLVAEVLANRAGNRYTLEEVATAPYQFSAYMRPDLTDFYLRQPKEVRDLARRLLQEVQTPGYEFRYPNVKHYVTKDLWDRRDSPGAPSWLRKMKPVAIVGNHVALIEK